MSIFIVDDATSTRKSILELTNSVERVVDQFRVFKQSHFADLTWVSGELKATLASWGESEVLNAMTRERVQRLVTALDEKMKEI